MPGTPGGLELVLARYGTRSLREVLAPAIQMCEDGTYVAPIKGMDIPRDDAQVRPDNRTGLAPEKRRNLALLRLLKTFAARNTCDSFYRGDIAKAIASAFRRHGGLVTIEDLAAFRAREMEPLSVQWNDMTIQTVPLPATGLLLLQASLRRASARVSAAEFDVATHATHSGMRGGAS